MRFSEGPVLMPYQKPEALNLTNDSLHSKHLQVKLFGQGGLVHDTQQLPCHQDQGRGDGNVGKTEEQSEVFFGGGCLFLFCFLLFVLFCEGLRGVCFNIFIFISF